MIRPMLSVELHQRVGIVAETRLAARTAGAGLVGLCIFMKLTSMKNGLSSLACALM